VAAPRVATPPEPVRDDQSRPPVSLLDAHSQTLGIVQWWPDGPAGRPRGGGVNRSYALRSAQGRPPEGRRQRAAADAL